MISLSGVVGIILFLLIAGAVFALLWFLVTFVGGKIAKASPEVGGWVVTIGQIVLVILAVLILIGLLLSFVSDKPLFRS